MTDATDEQIDVGLEVLCLYTTRNVAKMLQCSERRVRSLITSGKLRAVKDGANLRVTPEAIIEYKETLPPARAGRGECGTCEGSPPAGFICSACGRAGSVAS
jgi:excisionase family DNA binding protein